MDAFQPEGVTKLAQDSVFMMPHLGILSTVHPHAAMEIFEKDCLVKLGTCIAPGGIREFGAPMGTFSAFLPKGRILNENMTFGSIKRIELAQGNFADVEIHPEQKFDVGAGPGHTLKVRVEGGEVGLIFDMRGRPLTFPEEDEMRRRKLREWFSVLKAYPEKVQEMI